MDFRLLLAAAGRALRVIALFCAAAVTAACVTPPAGSDEEPAHEPEAAQVPEAAAAPPPADLPKQELTADLLYEFSIAELAAQRGELARSAQLYADLARRTRDPRVAERATEIAMFARLLEPAISSAKLWAEVSPSSTKALLTASSLLIRAQRIAEAEPYLLQIFAAQNANRGEAFLQLNSLLTPYPDKAASLQVIQHLAAPYPELPQAHFAVAQGAVAAGQDELALKEVREAARLAPEWEHAALFEASLLQKTSNALAAERLAAYLARYPKSREVRLAHARLLAADRKFPEARGELDRLLKDYPDNTDVLFTVAVLAMQVEDWAAAEKYLQRLLALGYRDRNTVRFYLGTAAEEQKRFPEALKWYAEVTRGEQYLPAQVRTAHVMSKQGDLPGARKYLQQINVTTNAQRVQLVLAEAQLLRDAKQSQEAFDLVDGTLTKMPNDPDLLYEHAMLAEKIERTDVLEASLRKLIDIKPDHAHAYNALGYSLADRNLRLDEAKALIDQALKLSPDDFFIVDSLGWVLYRQGKNEEALKQLQRAYAGRPDPEIAAHLGEVLWVSGRKDEARKVWNEALAKTPNNDVLIKTVQRFKP